MTLKAIETACNRSESSGTTTFNDGTKMYWTEGYGITTYVKSDGTRIEVDSDNDHTEWNAATEDGNEMGTMRMATREDEIEYEMMSGNLSREEAERNINELDAELNQ